MVHAVLVLIVCGLIFWVLIWFIDWCGIPEPFNKVAKVIVGVFAVLVVIGALMSLIGGQQIFRP